MGDIVELRKHPVDLANDDGFVTDLARFAEKLIDEKTLRRKYAKKYQLNDGDWQTLGEDDALVDAISEKKLQRMRNGSSKKEIAQKHVMGAPDILNHIMTDANQSARAKIESIKTLDQLAQEKSAEQTAVGERFVITINLGETTEVYDKQVKPITIETDEEKASKPIDDDEVEAPAIVSIGAKKRESDGGEPL